jgi:hypothetical protein
MEINALWQSIAARVVFGANSTLRSTMFFLFCVVHSIRGPVYRELLIRQAAWHATLLHPFLYVVDLKRALNFGEAQGFVSPKHRAAITVPFRATASESPGTAHFFMNGITF